MYADRVISAMGNRRAVLDVGNSRAACGPRSVRFHVGDVSGRTRAGKLSFCRLSPWRRPFRVPLKQLAWQFGRSFERPRLSGNQARLAWPDRPRSACQGGVPQEPPVSIDREDVRQLPRLRRGPHSSAQARRRGRSFKYAMADTSGSEGEGQVGVKPAALGAPHFERRTSHLVLRLQAAAPWLVVPNSLSDASQTLRRRS